LLIQVAVLIIHALFMRYLCYSLESDARQLSPKLFTSFQASLNS